MIPVTDIGRFVNMHSSLFCVTIIALPFGVITATYLEELRSLKENENKIRERTSSLRSIYNIKSYKNIIVIIALLIIGAAANITCPDKQTHKYAIKAIVDEKINEEL